MVIICSFSIIFDGLLNAELQQKAALGRPPVGFDSANIRQKFQTTNTFARFFCRCRLAFFAQDNDTFRLWLRIGVALFQLFYVCAIQIANHVPVDPFVAMLLEWAHLDT